MKISQEYRVELAEIVYNHFLERGFCRDYLSVKVNEITPGLRLSVYYREFSVHTTMYREHMPTAVALTLSDEMTKKAIQGGKQAA